MLAFADDEGKKTSYLTRDPCSSRWFLRFLLGTKRRMGQDWRPNQAISVEQMHALLKEFERRAIATTLHGCGFDEKGFLELHYRNVISRRRAFYMTSRR
jgi:hypothetical protein